MTANMSLANGDSAPFWEGAASGRLLVQKCRSCGSVQFPPRHHCATCWDAELDWVESAGSGSVESFTIVRRAPLPAFRDDVPYVVAAIHVDEGFRMITNILGEDRLEVAIGDRVHVDFAAGKGKGDGAGPVLPQFRRRAA